MSLSNNRRLFVVVVTWLLFTAPGVLAASIEPIDAAGINKLIKQANGSPVLLNLWATSCEPCLEKFPKLLALEKKYRQQGLKLLLVSCNLETELAEVKDYLRQQKVGFPSYIKSGDTSQFISGLHPDWPGVLPATFIFDAKGKLRYFWSGDETPPKPLEQLLLEVLRERR